MTKEQSRIIQMLTKAFYSKFWFITDFQSIESEAFFIYTMLLSRNKKDNKSLKFYLYKRLMSLIRREAIQYHRNLIISEKIEDCNIHSSPIDPNRELDFRRGLDRLSPDAKALVNMIFDEKSDIDKFNIQGITRASKKIGMRRNNCLRAVKEIQAFLRSL